MSDEMTPTEYLRAVLREQTLAPDGPELEQLREERERIRGILKEVYGTAPAVKEGGSKAKRTMIRESYDLDLFCYFPRDDTSAGETLEEIYNHVACTLEPHFWVERRRSALRLHVLESGGNGPNRGEYLHVDMVPGRYIEGSSGDVNLHQDEGEKRSQKTNPDVHIDHVRNSGVRSAIRLAKLWNVRRNLGVKTFVLELLVVEILEEHKGASLPDQMAHLCETLRDYADTISIEDPANPGGNDLSDLLDETTRTRLASTADHTLSQIENVGWSSVFGTVEELSQQKKADALRGVATTIASNQPTRPYWNDGRSLV